MAKRSARLALAFSCVGHAYMHFFTAFYAVVVLALEIDWRLSYHELIELWALGSALVGLAALPAGWLGDRWSAGGMMVVFFVGLGLAGILCAFVDSTTAMFLGLSAIGLFSAIYHPVGIAWLVRNAASRGKALGINGIFGPIGIAAGTLGSGLLIDLYGWRAAFLVPGALCLATGLLLWLCLRLGIVDDRAEDRRRDPPPSRGEMLRVFAVLLLTMFCMGQVFQGTQTVMPKLFDIRLRDIAGEGTFGIGAIVAVVYLIGGLMQVVGGHMADRYPLKPIYLAAWALQVPVLLAVAALGGYPLIAVAIAVVLLTAAPLPAENMLLARYTPARHRSLAFGVKFVLAFGSAPLAIWLAAQVQERTGEFVWLFALFAGLAGLCALAVILLPAERRAVAAGVAAE